MRKASESTLTPGLSPQAPTLYTTAVPTLSLNNICHNSHYNYNYNLNINNKPKNSFLSTNFLEINNFLLNHSFKLINRCIGPINCLR